MAKKALCQIHLKMRCVCPSRPPIDRTFLAAVVDAATKYGSRLVITSLMDINEHVDPPLSFLWL